jgi:hypothetical protein
MLGASMPDEKRKRSFEERFDIQVGLEEAKRRFVNRALNVIETISIRMLQIKEHSVSQ